MSADMYVMSSLALVKALKKNKLVMGIDYTTEKGAVANGRPGQVLLRFNDANKALMFKMSYRGN